MNHNLSPAVVARAVEVGLIDSPDQEDRLLNYVMLAAMFTSEYGNRRYGDYAFQIDTEGHVSEIHQLAEAPCNICKGIGREATFEVCEQCDGDGCRYCADEGGFEVLITCQSCK